MQTQIHPRYKKRIPCEFNVGERHHIGVVLNVSQGGLFISSRVAPSIGSRVELDLEPDAKDDAIPVRARVVWKKKVHRSLNKMGEGGIGLVIEESSPAYERWVVLISGAAVSAAKVEATEPIARDFCFQVRLALVGTPRTRSLTVKAPEEESARVRAVETCGVDWSILEIKQE